MDVLLGSLLVVCLQCENLTNCTIPSLIAHRSLLITHHNVGLAVERCPSGMPYERANFITLCVSVIDRFRVPLRADARGSPTPRNRRGAALGHSSLRRHVEPSARFPD